MVAECTVNGNYVKEVGSMILDKMINKNSVDFTFKKKDRYVAQSPKLTVKFKMNRFKSIHSFYSNDL